MTYDFKDKLYLVTGGSGFLGKPLVKRLLDLGAKVRVLARDHGKLGDLTLQFPSVEVIPGDVCDIVAVKKSLLGVSGVFHLAASKHVTLAETEVRECIKSNTVGSLNLLEESINHPSIEFILGISTDKASQVAGVYGASKFLMERLFAEFEIINPKCDYRIVRYGNVLYSTGSVLCKWKELIMNRKGVTVTDPNATRFFWTVDQAIDLIFGCLQNSTDASPYVPEMKSMSIGDLLAAMYEKYGDPNYTLSIKTIGLMRGENLHEKILENGKNSSECERYTIEEIKQLI
jgi:UDP-N-acetylglucosamine 4,6-dehydratase/UDP-glucose 4-epimerase